MTKYIYKVSQILASVAFMTIPSTTLISNIGSLTLSSPVTKVEISVNDIREQKAKVVDSFFKSRNMPLEGTGITFVLVAEKYGLDYRLLPAIAIRESSGGKAACGKNAFGWGSCKCDKFINGNCEKFGSYEEAIEILGRNLGGGNSKTSSKYAGKTNYDKLYHYNGTVLPTYPDEVIAIMSMLETDTE